MTINYQFNQWTSPYRADFIAKLEIALKEANETGKWLEMLYKTDYY